MFLLVQCVDCFCEITGMLRTMKKVIVYLLALKDTREPFVRLSNSDRLTRDSPDPSAWENNSRRLEILRFRYGFRRCE